VAPPFKQVEFDILYGEGICASGDLIDTAVEMGILDKMGAWYSLDGERLGQGREKVRQLMKDDPRLFDKLDHKVREVAFTPDGQLAPAAAAVAATVMAEG
jgi:recombination protein RecA